MSAIINNYPVFESSQVLTSGQLNQMIKYLDQQNRLTRITLLGMGVVCGMKLNCETNIETETTTLTISKGVGVTSEGFLITIGDCPTTRYRIYNKPDTVSYPPFESGNITLYELLTETALTDPEDEVLSLYDMGETALGDMVVLLYLECFDKDLKSCLGKSCDELGIDRIFTLRKLLISKDDLEDHVWPEIEGGKSDASFPFKSLLQPYLWPRPLFQPEISTYHAMCLKYLSVLGSDTFLNVLSQTYSVYGPVLGDIYGEDPFASTTITSKIDDIVEFAAGFANMESPQYGIQYIYDFVKDVALAYEEFREVSFDLSSACCPDIDRFPKHLMLGEACGAAGDSCVPLEYRNEFVSSPILNQQETLLEKVRFLHKRMVLLILSFDLDRLKNPANSNFKITPSCEKKGSLSERTIPIYYNISTVSTDSAFENLGTLENTWNYELYKQCTDSDIPQQMSYDNHDFENVPEHPISTPLGYDLDQFNFLRIEGILAKTVADVKDDIIQAKKKWNLSFDVKTVYFGNLLEEEKPVPDCIASDLQTDYAIWRNKMLLILNSILRTSRTVENTIRNRSEYSKLINDIVGIKETKVDVKENSGSAEFSNKEAFEKSSISSSTLFDKQRFPNLVDKEGKPSLTAITRNLYAAEMKLAAVPKKAKLRRSATFTRAIDDDIDGLFSKLNECLQGLIQAMPEDLKEFDMQEWLDKYKCVMHVYINAMKFIVRYANNLTSMLIMLVVLYVMCVILDVIKYISIYPYITIRTLYDTLQERVDQLAESLKYVNFLEDHPGMDHKAGVAPGETFVLVYQSIFENSDEIINFLESEKSIRLLEKISSKKLIGLKEIESEITTAPESIREVFEEMEQKVVADFTLPFICCDECGNLPHTPLPLDPLVAPICGTVTFDDENLGEYRTFSKQVLNNLYDPDVYRVSKTGDPAFGTAKLVDVDYLPDPTKKIQRLEYNVEKEKIGDLGDDDYFIIDEFPYEVIDTTTNEVVGDDTITIFIPVIKGFVTGVVSRIDESGNKVPVFNVRVEMEETDLFVFTKEDGTYEMPIMSEGEYTLIASHAEYGQDSKTVTLVKGINEVDFIIAPEIVTGTLKGKVIVQMGDEISPAVGALVSIENLGLESIADQKGNYTIIDIPAGPQLVITTLTGFTPKSTNFDIQQGENNLDVTFEEDVQLKGQLRGTVEGISAEGKQIPLQGADVMLFSKKIISDIIIPLYSTVTNIKGNYDISDIVPRAYRVGASYSGYIADQEEIIIKGGSVNRIDFILQTTPDKDIDFDRILEAKELSADTHEAELIKKYYSSEMAKYLLIGEKLDERLGGPEITPITDSNKTIKEIAESKDINVIRLNNEFNNNRNDLVEAYGQSEGKDKEVYAEAIQNLTNAYLTRLAFTQPENLTDSSKDILKETSSIFNANKELNMKGSVGLWLENSKGYVTEDYRVSVQQYLKLS